MIWRNKKFLLFAAKGRRLSDTAYFVLDQGCIYKKEITPTYNLGWKNNPTKTKQEFSITLILSWALPPSELQTKKGPSEIPHIVGVSYIVMAYFMSLRFLLCNYQIDLITQFYIK